MKKIITIISVVLIAIICLFFSNRVISSVWNSKHHSSIQKTTVDEMNSNLSTSVNAALDYCYVQNELFDILAINGWVYSADTADVQIENKKTELFICSATSCYKIICENYLRHDDWKPNGFGTEVSLLGLPTGLYRIYIKNTDNQTDYGIYATPYLVKINTSGINVCDWEASETLIDSPVIANAGMQYDPGISIESNAINLWGWAYLTDTDSADQEVYIQLKNENNETFYYTTDKVRRDSIAYEQNAPKYLMSGFQTSIQLENASNTKWTIRLLIKDKQFVYGSHYLFQYNPETSSIDWIKASQEKASEITLNNEYPISVNDEMRYDPGISVSDSKLMLYGWACLLNESADQQSVIIEVGDGEGDTQYYSTDKVIREGVAEYLNSSLYEKSGFCTQIDIPKNKTLYVKIIIYSDGNYYKSPHTFIYDPVSKAVLWTE